MLFYLFILNIIPLINHEMVISERRIKSIEKKGALKVLRGKKV